MVHTSPNFLHMLCVLGIVTAAMDVSLAPPASRDQEWLYSSEQNLVSCVPWTTVILLSHPAGVFILNLVCRDLGLKDSVLAGLKAVFPLLYVRRIEGEVNEILFCQLHSECKLATPELLEMAQALEQTLRKPGKGWDDTYVLSDMLNTVKIVWVSGPGRPLSFLPDWPQAAGLPETRRNTMCIKPRIFLSFILINVRPPAREVAWRSGRIKKSLLCCPLRYCLGWSPLLPVPRPWVGFLLELHQAWCLNKCVPSSLGLETSHTITGLLCFFPLLVL